MTVKHIEFEVDATAMYKKFKDELVAQGCIRNPVSEEDFLNNYNIAGDKIAPALKELFEAAIRVGVLYSTGGEPNIDILHEMLANIQDASVRMFYTDLGIDYDTISQQAHQQELHDFLHDLVDQSPDMAETLSAIEPQWKESALRAMRKTAASEEMIQEAEENDCPVSTWCLIAHASYQVYASDGGDMPYGPEYALMLLNSGETDPMAKLVPRDNSKLN